MSFDSVLKHNRSNTKSPAAIVLDQLLAEDEEYERQNRVRNGGQEDEIIALKARNDHNDTPTLVELPVGQNNKNQNLSSTLEDKSVTADDITEMAGANRVDKNQEAKAKLVKWQLPGILDSSSSKKNNYKTKKEDSLILF